MTNTPYPNLQRKRILVIERDNVPAVDYCLRLKNAGAIPINIVPSVTAALCFLNSHDVEAVVVNDKLCGCGSGPIYDALRTRGIPFVVILEYDQVNHSHSDIPRVLSKPVSSYEVCDALSVAIEQNRKS